MQNEKALAQLRNLIECTRPKVEGKIAETALEVTALVMVMNVSNDLGFQSTFVKPGEGVRLLAFGHSYHGKTLVEALIPAFHTMITRLGAKRRAELTPTWSLGSRDRGGRGHCGPIRFETRCVYPEMWVFRVTDDQGKVLDQGVRRTPDAAAAACEGISRNKALLAREDAERKAKDAIEEGRRVYESEKKRLCNPVLSGWIITPDLRM